MAEGKFAYESEEVSIAFTLDYGMGDCIIAKKVFDALIELVPNCQIDIFWTRAPHENFAKAFYGSSKNLNLILNREELYLKIVQNYDLSILVGAGFVVLLEWVNSNRLQTMSPTLWQAVVRINEFNKKYVHNAGPWGTAVAYRNMMWAHILNKNYCHFLSCDGALPINADKINISLLPKYKSKFENLKLDKYITLNSNIGKNEESPKVKVWPLHYLQEYVARMKKRLPQIEIVQCGGGGDIKIGNVDCSFLGCELELTKYILANSLLHVSCEGGIVHLAASLGTKCLVLFGPSSSYYMGYDKNINLVSEVCHPCMHSHLNFRTCMRGAKEPPCMLYHTPQTVCEITCTYLKNKA